MSNDDKKLNLVSTENGYRLELIDNKNSSHKFISNSWGTYFETIDIKYVRKVSNFHDLPDNSGINLPVNISEFFVCEGKVSNGSRLGVIGDDDETSDIQITFHRCTEDYEKILISYQSESVDEDDRKFINDCRLGKSIADWEIQTSSTYFWLTVDLSSVVFDSILEMYNLGNLDSIDMRVVFKFANLYTDASHEQFPFASSVTYFLLPDEKYGVRSPKMSVGHLDIFNINGKKLTSSTEQLKMYSGLSNQDDSALEKKASVNSLFDSQAFYANQVTYIKDQLGTLNQTLKYVMYAVVVFVLVNFLK